jgi:hypothetical protein
LKEQPHNETLFELKLNEEGVARRSNESILKHDPVVFNGSYKFLASALRMLVLTEVLNLAIFTVFFFVELRFYKNLQ